MLPPLTKTNSTSKHEDIDVETTIRKKILDELHDKELVKYATRVDDDYDNAMANKLSNFSEVRLILLSDNHVSVYYNDLKVQFPSCHFVFATSHNITHVFRACWHT